MITFYTRNNQIFMSDGTVTLTIADLRPELTGSQKIKIEEALKEAPVFSNGDIRDLLNRLRDAENYANNAEWEIRNIKEPRPVIDVENLEVWPSVRACARAVGIKHPRIYEAILLGGLAAGSNKREGAKTMSKIVKAKIEVGVEVSQYDAERCSRDCPFCEKTNGNYKCYLRNIYGVGAVCDEIEGFDGFDDFDASDTADSYGFKRTELCLKIFGNALIADEAGA